MILYNVTLGSFHDEVYVNTGVRYQIPYTTCINESVTCVHTTDSLALHYYSQNWAFLISGRDSCFINRLRGRFHWSL